MHMAMRRSRYALPLATVCVFLGIVYAGAGSGSSDAAESPKPPKPPEPESKPEPEDNDAMAVKFQNRGIIRLQAFWVSHTGEEISVGDVPAVTNNGGLLGINSFVGHTFVIKSPSSRQTVVVKRGKNIYEVGDANESLVSGCCHREEEIPSQKEIEIEIESACI